MFATDQNKTDTDYYLKGDPVSLIATNIPSFMGGKANPWMSGDTHAHKAITDKTGSIVTDEGLEDSYKEQSYSDGLLEFCTISSFTNLALATA